MRWLARARHWLAHLLRLNAAEGLIAWSKDGMPLYYGSRCLACGRVTWY